MSRKRNVSPTELAAWFWSNVDQSAGTSACWSWMATKKPSGYGDVRWAGRRQGAHRLAYELTNGPIPEGEGYHGTCVLHRCDNPPCCNPAHLWLGSAADNRADMLAKGRGSTIPGPGRPPKAPADKASERVELRLTPLVMSLLDLQRGKLSRAAYVAKLVATDALTSTMPRLGK